LSLARRFVRLFALRAVFAVAVHSVPQSFPHSPQARRRSDLWPNECFAILGRAPEPLDKPPQCAECLYRPYRLGHGESIRELCQDYGEGTSDLSSDQLASDYGASHQGLRFQEYRSGWIWWWIQ